MSSTEKNAFGIAPVEQAAIKSVAKKVARPVAKRIARPAVQVVPTVTVAAPVETKSDKLLKPKKSKMVPLDFTLPMLEYLMLETLKLRSSKLGSPVKKNVLIRAGIKALADLSDARFLAALKTVHSIKGARASKD
jgi:hypothetical protein